MKKSLSFKNWKKTCFSEPPNLVPITFGREKFDEGTSAQILCSVSAGDEPMAIRWTFHGNSISSDSGITTSNFGTKTSLLMINSVRHEHRGSYTCSATNDAGSTSSSAELNINGWCEKKEMKGRSMCNFSIRGSHV